jgi:cytochrome P450
MTSSTRLIERRTGGSGRGQDLISLLLAARDPETGAQLSRQEIRDQVLIFLLAGHETTSTALTFTIHLLGRHGRFDPRRFEPAAEAARPRYAYFPFAGGLRGCIGGHFAMAEATVAVATLLGRFAVTSESRDIALSTDITLRPAVPVRCRVSLRQAAPASL